MTMLLVICGCLAGQGLTHAQEAADGQTPRGIQVIKLGWSKALPPGWDRPVYSASNPPRYDPASPSAGSSPPMRVGGRRNQLYIYSLKIRNSGPSGVKALAWEYRTIDPDDKKELGRHPFWTYTKIGVNKTVTLEGRSPAPPSRIVTVAGLEKNKRSPFIEQAVIKCVIYSDGSLWKNPATNDADCERLKRGVKRSR